MRVRKATLDDVELLVRLRVDYLTADYGPQEEHVLRAIEKQLREFFPAHIPGNDFAAFIADADGRAAATAFLTISTIPANPNFITGKVGTVLNVLTYPEFRKRGYASAVLRELIEEAKRMDVSALDLSATSDGLPVYEKLGFVADTHYTEMNLILRTAPK